MIAQYYLFTFFLMGWSNIFFFYSVANVPASREVLNVQVICWQTTVTQSMTVLTEISSWPWDLFTYKALSIFVTSDLRLGFKVSKWIYSSVVKVISRGKEVLFKTNVHWSTFKQWPRQKVWGRGGSQPTPLPPRVLKRRHC